MGCIRSSIGVYLWYTYVCTYMKSEVHCLHMCVYSLYIKMGTCAYVCMCISTYIRTCVCNWYHLGVIHTYVGMRALYTGVCKCGPV